MKICLSDPYLNLQRNMEPDGNQAKPNSSGDSGTRTICYLLRVRTSNLIYELNYFWMHITASYFFQKELEKLGG